MPSTRAAAIWKPNDFKTVETRDGAAVVADAEVSTFYEVTIFYTSYNFCFARRRRLDYVQRTESWLSGPRRG